MAALTWDETGERLFEAGVDHGVFYPYSSTGYGKGIAWNGLTSVSFSADGGEPNDIYADNIQYASIMSNEKVNLSIEAYMSPEEFDECDGTKTPIAGVHVGQQARKAFGFVCRTKIGNDVDDLEHGYKIHLVYGCKAAPSERNYETINDSPDAMTLSWDCTTTPVAFEGDDYEGYRPTAHIVIDSTKFTETADLAKLKAFEETLFGTDDAGSVSGKDPSLPLPAAVIAALS